MQTSLASLSNDSVTHCNSPPLSCWKGLPWYYRTVPSETIASEQCSEGEYSRCYKEIPDIRRSHNLASLTIEIEEVFSKDSLHN